MYFSQLTPDTYLLRFEKGEEVIETLKRWATSQNCQGGVVNGIGAVERIELAYFEINSKKYLTQTFNESREVTSLAGNISWKDDQVVVHLHGTFADRQMQTIAGHLNCATVSGTVELTVTVSQTKLLRSADDVTGLNLLTLEQHL